MEENTNILVLAPEYKALLELQTRVKVLQDMIHNNIYVDKSVAATVLGFKEEQDGI